MACSRCKLKRMQELIKKQEKERKQREARAAKTAKIATDELKEEQPEAIKVAPDEIIPESVETPVFEPVVIETAQEELVEAPAPRRRKKKEAPVEVEILPEVQEEEASVEE